MRASLHSLDEAAMIYIACIACLWFGFLLGMLAICVFRAEKNR